MSVHAAKAFWTLRALHHNSRICLPLAAEVCYKVYMKNTASYAIIGNKSYGLYAGYVDTFDAEKGIVEATGLRHIARWYGKEGGITSLAAFGLCGKQKKESKIGAAVERATLTGVVNVFYCSDEARLSIEEMGVK